MGLRVDSRETDLTDCVIVFPMDESRRASAAGLFAWLTARGLRPEMIPASKALDETGLRIRPELRGRTLLLIGDINTNRAMLPLYAGFMDFTDDYHPGRSGHVVRTVVNPFGTGANAIVLGSSSSWAARTAVERFIELAGAGEGPCVPYLCDIELDAEAKEALAFIGPRDAPADEAEFAGRDPFDLATKQAWQYALTGARRCAVGARVGFLGMLENSERRFMVGDYTLEPLVRAWGMLCDSGVFSPQEVGEIDEGFLRTLIASQDEYWRATDGSGIGSRHQTMGTSAFLAAVRLLLRRGAPNAAARELLERWQRECRAYFDNAVTTFHDDIEGMPSYHSFQPVANYALEEGVAEYFGMRPGGADAGLGARRGPVTRTSSLPLRGEGGGERAPLELAVRRALAATDNLGYYCGTGTYEEARPGAVKAGIMLGYPLAMAQCLNRDGRARWLLRHFQGTGVGTWGLLSAYGARAFAAGPGAVRERRPDEWLGVLTVPLGRYRYDRLSHDRRSARERGKWYTTAPYERTFEKLCFRNRFDPAAQYLVLQGLQGLEADNVPPRDANSIIRYTDNGHVWLIANTDRQGNFYRNAVYVSDGTNAEPQPAACEAVAVADFGHVGMTATRLPDYSGGDWTRHIFWLKGKYFAVVDTVRLQRDGQFAVFCT
ncbi:MAG: hypothetical protein JSV65_00475, partial [Armatimonadota bacterium]